MLLIGAHFSENEFGSLVPREMVIVIETRANTIMRLLWLGGVFEDVELLIVPLISWTTFKCPKKRTKTAQTKPLVLANGK